MVNEVDLKALVKVAEKWNWYLAIPKKSLEEQAIKGMLIGKKDFIDTMKGDREMVYLHVPGKSPQAS